MGIHGVQGSELVLYRVCRLYYTSRYMRRACRAYEDMPQGDSAPFQRVQCGALTTQNFTLSIYAKYNLCIIGLKQVHCPHNLLYTSSTAVAFGQPRV